MISISGLAHAASAPQAPGQIRPSPRALAPIAAGNTPATVGGACWSCFARPAARWCDFRGCLCGAAPSDRMWRSLPSGAHQAIAETLHIELALVATPVGGFGLLPTDQRTTLLLQRRP